MTAPGLEFAPQQQEAIRKITDWYASDDPDQQVFRPVRLRRHRQNHPGPAHRRPARDRALFAAFTGKAAYVLRTKGCEGASTVHS
jgi:exodeoxyribonuclease-5